MRAFYTQKTPTSEHVAPVPSGSSNTFLTVLLSMIMVYRFDRTPPSTARSLSMLIALVNSACGSDKMRTFPSA
ncbi:hypothetical protein BpHYR1_016006 [Brachionus plicatilis]|uniref:Uncharacterized protein n=1 Tax=Brachionus plicatilis TaxID=10195 RepID=A0A3M7RA26_BRAPC|nr:hypothetical protein BpHYR1_016006 [Brachionus plicatilis]